MAQNATDAKYERARSIIETYRNGGIYKAKAAMTRNNQDTELLFEFTSHLMSEQNQNQVEGGVPQEGQGPGKILAFSGKTPDPKLQMQLEEAEAKILELDLQLRQAQTSAPSNDTRGAIDDLKAQIAELEAIVKNGPDGDVYAMLRTARNQFSALNKTADDHQTTIASLRSDISTLLAGVEELKMQLAEQPTGGETPLNLPQLASMTLGEIADMLKPDAPDAPTPERADTGTYAGWGTMTSIPQIEQKAVTGYDQDEDDEDDDDDDDNEGSTEAEIADEDDDADGVSTDEGTEAVEVENSPATVEDAAPVVASEPTPTPVPSTLVEEVPAATSNKIEWLNTAGVFKKLGGDSEWSGSTVTFGGTQLTFRQLRQMGPEWFTAHGFEIDARRNANRKPWLRWTPAVDKKLGK